MSSPLADSRATDEALPERVQPGELIFVLVVFLVGLGLRGVFPGRMAVEHFDEGVYASNIFFTGEKGDEHYPGQHFYAPPLLPVLIEFSMLVLGPTSLGAMAVGIVAGSLTILLVWWVAREWFGPTAGLVAATLVALNDAHIAFSRTALTDVLLCFFLIAAVHCSWISQSRRSWGGAIAAGIFTGLAWWTKYNGWLPLAISFSGMLAWRLFEIWLAPQPGATGARNNREDVQATAFSLLLWGIVVAIAVAIWAPFWWSLQAKGGYAEVAANHGKYLVGPNGWSNSLVQQAQNLSLLSGPLTGCSPLVALGLALLRQRLVDSRFTWNALLKSNMLYLAVPVLGLLCVAEGGAVMLAFLGVVGTVVGAAVAITGGEKLSAVTPARKLAAWLIVAWTFGLILGVPMYKPYPRLMLPLLMASWIGVGVFAEVLIAEIQQAAFGAKQQTEILPQLSRRFRGRQALSRARPILLLVLIGGIGVAFTQHSLWSRGVPGWQPRNNLADLVPQIRDDLCRHAGVDPRTGLDQFVVYTYGEPALFFHLRATGCSYVKPVQQFLFANPEAPPPRITSYVAFGSQAWVTPGFGDQLAPALPRLQLVGKYKYVPSDIVLLDGSFVKNDRRQEYKLEIYFLK